MACTAEGQQRRASHCDCLCEKQCVNRRREESLHWEEIDALVCRGQCGHGKLGYGVGGERRYLSKGKLFSMIKGPRVDPFA